MKVLKIVEPSATSYGIFVKVLKQSRRARLVEAGVCNMRRYLVS